MIQGSADCRCQLTKNYHKVIAAVICVLSILTGQGCQGRLQTAAPVTVTIMDQSWLDKHFQLITREELDAFTSESGIPVKELPAPDAAVEQLAMFRGLLDSGAKVPDVFALDVIWPGSLADNLLDLKAFVPVKEIAVHFRDLIANNTVNGRLVALPSQFDMGLLFYRTDLLRRYGYRAPPRTWQELEGMATKIQTGERAKGHKNFWGFVWEGAASESLTCNALEWQMSEGGGAIIEGHTVTVNNSRAARAWERAAGWVGSISPPSVVAYKEGDAFSLWNAGNAAFMRNWTGAYVLSQAQESVVKHDFDVSPPPEGCSGKVGTLGGRGYGVSRYSLHPREAVLLVRYLASRDVQLKRAMKSTGTPTIPDLYQMPEVVAANSYLAEVKKALGRGFAVRPSTETGKNYSQVSRAYFEAVHAVLTREKSAGKAAADLQSELSRITAFPAATKRPGPLCAN